MTIDQPHTHYWIGAYLWRDSMTETCSARGTFLHMRSLTMSILLRFVPLIDSLNDQIPGEQYLSVIQWFTVKSDLKIESQRLGIWRDVTILFVKPRPCHGGWKQNHFCSWYGPLWSWLPMCVCMHNAGVWTLNQVKNFGAHTRFQRPPIFFHNQKFPKRRSLNSGWLGFSTLGISSSPFFSFLSLSLTFFS